MKLRILICGIVLIGIVGCNRTEREWKQENEANSASAYADFITRHPDGPHVNEARLSLDDFHGSAARNALLGMRRAVGGSIRREFRVPITCQQPGQFAH